jgi:hypothetical protein
MQHQQQHQQVAESLRATPATRTSRATPRSFFADDFESYTSPSELGNKWDNVYQPRNNVLVRALGPSLTALGVNGALADPILTLYDSNGNVITANDNWKDSQQEAIENTALQPPDDFEAAIFTTLTTGSYTHCYWQKWQ